MNGPGQFGGMDDGMGDMNGLGRDMNSDMRGDMRDGREPEDDALQDLTAWLQMTLARYAAEQIPGVVPPQTPKLGDVVRVVLERKESASTTDQVEFYEHALGQGSVSQLALDVARRAQNDSDQLGGGVYFVRVHGFPTRKTLAFSPPERGMVRRENGYEEEYGGGGSGSGNGSGRERFDQNGRPMPMQRAPQNGLNAFGGPGSGYNGPRGGMNLNGSIDGGYGRSMSGGSPMSPVDPNNPVTSLIYAMGAQQGALMNHNETYARLIVSMTESSTRALRDTNRDLLEAQRRNFDSEKRNIIAYEEMASRKAERDLAFEKEKKAEERKDKVIGMIEPVAMSFASKITGKTPESAPIMNQMRAALATLTPEQFQAMQQILNPEQLQNIGQVLNTIQSIEEQEDKKNAAKNGQGQNGQNG